MKAVSRPALAGAATLLLGLLLAALAMSWQGRQNAVEAEARFQLLASRVAEQVRSRIHLYEYGLRGARGAVVASPGQQIDRQAFQRYSVTRDADGEFPGARGFGIIWRVPVAGQGAFVAAARRDGWPDFDIRQIETHAGERYVIQYAEPVERNRAAVGLDVASEPARRAAALAAMRSGQATLTEPITLVQASGKPSRSFLVLLPIYRPGLALDSTAQREAATIGWSYAAVVIDEVLQLIESDAGHYRLTLRDTQAADSRAFYGPLGISPTAEDGPQSSVLLPIFGRTWQAELQATPAFVQALRQPDPRHVGLVWALITNLCAALVWVLAGLVARTRSEHLAQARRAAIVEASDDAIIGEDLEGRVTDWNGGAERLFGHPAALAVGQHAQRLLSPPGLDTEEAAMRSAIDRGERVAPFATHRRHRDGTLIAVTVTAAPIVGADGRNIGLSKTVRDMRDAVRDRQALAALNESLEAQVAERTARLDATMHDLRAIIDAVPSVIGYWDRKLVNRMANQAYLPWFGIDPQTLPGRSLLDVMGAAQFELARNRVEGALRGEAQTFERAYPRPDGQGLRHALVHYLPDTVDGEVRGFYSMLHDVSELVDGRQALAAALRDNEALLRTIHQHAIVSVADRSGRISEVNDAFCAISGYSRDELIGQDHRLLNAGHHERDFWVAMWRCIASGQAWHGEVCNRAKDGTLYWVNSIVAPFIGADGRVEKFISIRTDITAAKLTEQRLRSSEAFLDRAGQIAGVGGWELDLRTHELHWSAETRRIHEVGVDYMPKLEEAIRFYPPESRLAIEQAVADGIEHGAPFDLELPLLTAKGNTIWVRTVGAVEFDSGEAVRLTGAFQDVTERRRAEAALAHERQLMTSLLDTLPDPIYFKDLDSRFLRINPAMAHRFGLADKAQAVGKSDADFFTPEHAARSAALDRRIVDTGEPVLNLEEEEQWPERGPTWSMTTKMPLHDADGLTIGTFGISRDITARRVMEGELQRTNERFLLAAESVGLGVWEYDIEAGTLVWDERMHQLYGSTRSTGNEPFALWRDNLHPEDRDTAMADLQAAIDGLKPFDIAFRIRLPDGSVRHLRAAGHVQRDSTGRALRMTGVNYDISERVRAEDELRQTMTLLHAVLDSATQVSIIAVKPDGLISVFNRGAEEMLGYRGDELVGQATSLIFHEPGEMQQRAAELSVQLGRKVHTGMVLVDTAVLGVPQAWNYRRKDGSSVPVELAVTAMRSERGELFGYLGIAHDVSRRQAHESELRHAMLAAEQASRAKSQFLANMSHEIRTPMNAVIGLSYLLERTALDAGQADTLAKIKLASQSLLGLLNDVLDLSKIEAGGMTVESAPFALPELLSDLAQLMSMQADAKAIHFELVLPAGLPPAVAGDAVRLRQVLSNLCSNAIKFTERGGVQLKVRVLDGTPDSVRLRFAVRDSGIGIAPQALHKLFTPFVQADESTTRRYGGTGLGLSIVKQLVALMGGQVGVSSEPGLGSEFWVELALKPCDAGALPGASAVPGPVGLALRGVRVLLADDNAVNLEVARRILELEGAEVVLASNGQQAVERLQQDPRAVDIVLMDVQMPVLDGLDATRRIRQSPALAGVPVVAMTAGISDGESQRAKAAGMVDVVGKPFDPPALVRCILRHVAPGRPAAAAAPRAVVRADPQAAWPHVEGIDSQDVRVRLGGDAGLFRSMLKRLLKDFAGLGSEAAAPELLAPRMHSLKGSAGTLGAKAIERLAARAEVASRAGDGEQAAALTLQLSHALQALQQHAAALLQPPVPGIDSDSRSAGPVADRDAVADLLRQLRSADLGAMQRFAELGPQLQRSLGAEAFGRLSEQIDNLEFDDAARAIEAGF